MGGSWESERRALKALGSETWNTVRSNQSKLTDCQGGSLMKVIRLEAFLLKCCSPVDIVPHLITISPQSPKRFFNFKLPGAHL